MNQYTRLFEAAGQPVPAPLEELTKKYQRIEQMTRTDHLANFDVLAVDASQITQRVRAAAQRDIEAAKIAEHWSQQRVTGWASTYDRGWAGELQRAAQKVFVEHAPALLEARKAEFSEAADALGAVILAIGAEPDPGVILSEADPEAVRAYQHREATTSRLTALRAWRRAIATAGYGEPIETVHWWLDEADPKRLDHATAIWERHSPDPFPRLLEAGYSLSLNSAEQAASLVAAHQAARQRQQEVARPRTEKEIRQEFSGRQEVMAREYGSLAQAPASERRALQRWLDEELAKAEDNAWVVS